VLNPFREVNWRPGVPERRKFAVSLMLCFPLGAAAWWGLSGGRTGSQLPLLAGAAGFALGATLWLVPQIARPFYVSWYGLACAMGLVVGNVCLGSIYLLMFVPVGCVMRLGGRKPFRKSFDRTLSTYWQDAPAPSDPARYYRQF
jgi:hypothetical protein